MCKETITQHPFAARLDLAPATIPPAPHVDVAANTPISPLAGIAPTSLGITPPGENATVHVAVNIESTVSNVGATSASKASKAVAVGKTKRERTKTEWNNASKVEGLPTDKESYRRRSSPSTSPPSQGCQT